MLTTFGGDLEAAYRITRCIQSRYSLGEFILFTDGYCKSAGTLIALGADRIVMTDHAELGPLDTQVMVRDELGEYQSGLIDSDALGSLQQEVFTNFSGQFEKLLSLGRGNLTTQTALRIASELTLGLFGGIYSQINPIRFGERARAVQVALQYGERVSSTNVHDGTLGKLATSYPSHGFVIDRQEADSLFIEVYGPSPEMSLLSDCLRTPIDDLHSSGLYTLEHLNAGISERFRRWIELFFARSEIEETGETDSDKDAHLETENNQQETQRAATEVNGSNGTKPLRPAACSVSANVYVAPIMEEAENDTKGLEAKINEEFYRIGNPSDKDGNIPDNYKHWVHRDRDRKISAERGRK